MDKMPRYNIPAILRLRDKLYDTLNEFVAAELIGETFARFVNSAVEVLPKNIPHETVFTSLLSLTGSEVTLTLAMEVAWRLAGNLRKLKAGIAVPQWTRQTATEWVPVQILEMVPGENYRKERGYHAHMRVLAGSPCPMRISKFWSQRYCSWMARNFGFSRPHRKTKGLCIAYHHGSEFTNLRLMVLLDPQLTKDGKPGFDTTSITSGMKNWNSTIMKARAHVSPPCPEKYEHPCHMCYIGYDRCLAGTHPRTWEARYCTGCNQDAWFDPKADTPVCITCSLGGK